MNIDNSILSWIATVLTVILGGAGVGGLVTALKTKKKIRADKDEDLKRRAEAAAIIEETAARQVQRVQRAAERAEEKVCLAEEKAERLRNESNEWESQCSLLRGEVAELTRRLDEDVSDCRRQILDLQNEVITLKDKNLRLVRALERNIERAAQRGIILEGLEGLDK